MPDDIFLVDTSAWLLALRKDFLPIVKDRISYLLKENLIVTAGIINLELLGGTRSKKEFQRLKSRLSALYMVPTDYTLWEDAYLLAFELRRKGITVPHTDILVSTCAREMGAIIVHADSHFDLMKKHFNLKVESYVKDIPKQRK